MRLLTFIMAIAAVPALLSLSVSGHELGDFGRVKPGVVNDELIPQLDRWGRKLAGQPVSDFNITDQEREMHDRIYRFLIARHVKDWAFDYEQIVMVAGRSSTRPGRDDLYYRWLTREPYASSRVRYNTISDDVGADVLSMPSTFAAICAVIVVDRQRAVAAGELDDVEASMIVQMRTRKAENDLYVARFVRALRYRYESYSYALDHFLVETPHAEAVTVDGRLSDYAIWLDRAEAGDFCVEGDGSWRDQTEALPGRVLLDAPSEGEYRK
ncbi:MAG: hypothetical protein J0I99_16455 [Devosia sp.]|uniref:hypothetical protein n=1 Tax=Devosia sp. TaxID=1871048 RepID=UPI001AC79D6E|nr:hypothetical protein [Devosia sp.]MBN9317336.1 hypothetical protein [Devosia sp.]